MNNNKIKWLIYTVLVGLIPIISRLLAWLVTQDGAVGLPTAPDFVAFGLVLHISNINELEHFSSIDKTWKTVQNGTSIVFISLYSILFTLTLLTSNSIVNQAAINWCAFVLSIVSFLLSYSVYDYLSKERQQ